MPTCIPVSWIWIWYAQIFSSMILSLSPVWLLHQDRFPEWLPADAFLLETDESALPLRDIYSHAAKLRGETMEDLAGILQKTFDRWLFR